MLFIFVYLRNNNMNCINVTAVNSLSSRGYLSVCLLSVNTLLSMVLTNFEQLAA